MNPMLHPAGALLLAAVLGACVEAPPRPDDETDLAVRSLLAEERYLEAGTEYRNLAERAQGEAVWHFTLNAARALIAGGRGDEALRTLGNGDWVDASADQRRERAALRAELLLAGGDAQEALALLDDSLFDGAAASIARDLRRTRAAAFLASGRPLEAAREGVALEALGLATGTASANRHFIWEALGRLTSVELEAARIPPPSPLGGWIELAAHYRTFRFDHASFEAALRVWASRFPGHSAASELVPVLRADSAAASKPPARIALLLPASGAFADAARAIRDGFLAAWYLTGDPSTRPVLIFRDTSDADIAALLAGVAEEGAEFVVGPLRKSAVRAAAKLGRPALPVLALNRLDDDAGPPPEGDFYQFALSPEGEAREVARQARRDGYARAGVLVPEGAWGARVAGAFAEAWERLGGRVVEARTYATGSDEKAQPPDMSEPVELLLNLDESRERRDTLRRLVGRRLYFEPRRRTDVDLVFLAGFPRELRQLRPQFEFHDAGSVPIYSTSHVYTGVSDPAADGDLEDIVFGDMPMLLPAAPPDAAMPRRLASLWPERLRAYPRLHAFGLDAFSLVMRLRHLEASTHHHYAGHTGVLRLDEQGRVHRRLRWARFEDGLPRPLNPRTDAF